MNDLGEILNRIGVGIPTVLLPRKGTDLTKWSVVACDQYTSQPEYWAKVEAAVGEAPSTLRLIFPEVYLGQSDEEERIDRIVQTMNRYLAEGVLVPQKPGFIYVDRRTVRAQSRKGLLVTLDLERYDYAPGSQTPIRATEGTVLDRLPPRIRIRERAILELPHIMVLIDDPGRTVIEPVAAAAERLEKLYDFDLMMGGGHLKGYRVDDEALIAGIARALEGLAEPAAFRTKYGVGPEKGVLLFAVGDGNHSLATAKACWERLKPSLSAAEIETHPARRALVEIINVHDPGLQFEPIHRVVFGTEPEKMLAAMKAYYQNKGSATDLLEFADEEEMLKGIKDYKSRPGHLLPFVAKNRRGAVVVRSPQSNLEVGTLQAFLDEYVRANPEVKIDYIHGEDVVASLGSKEGNTGFYLPPMDKNDLFKTVILDGVLPRKTFSMGEAEEKRFYLECRGIAGCNP